jgi:hypothetical protein
MAIANFIAQLARMNPTGAIITVTFILLTVPALVGGILALERRFSLILARGPWFTVLFRRTSRQSGQRGPLRAP